LESRSGQFQIVPAGVKVDAVTSELVAADHKVLPANGEISPAYRLTAFPP
jgi:hypothetical protein